jgi:hypothetical protein
LCNIRSGTSAVKKKKTTKRTKKTKTTTKKKTKKKKTMKKRKKKTKETKKKTKKKKTKKMKKKKKQCVLKPRFTICNVFKTALKDTTHKENDTSCGRSAENLGSQPFPLEHELI